MGYKSICECLRGLNKNEVVIHATSPTRSELKLHVCMGNLSCEKGIPHLDHDALKGGGDPGSHTFMQNIINSYEIIF